MGQKKKLKTVTKPTEKKKKLVIKKDGKKMTPAEYKKANPTEIKKKKKLVIKKKTLSDVIADFKAGRTNRETLEKKVKEQSKIDGKKRKITEDGRVMVAKPADNLKKAVGISQEQAKKMDFFDLMKHLPEDIRRNIGGFVKEDRKVTVGQRGDLDYMNEMDEMFEDTESHLLDVMNVTDNYEGILTESEARWYKIYGWSDSPIYKSDLTKKQHHKRERLDMKLMEGISNMIYKEKENVIEDYIKKYKGKVFNTKKEAEKYFEKYAEKNFY